MVGYQQIAPTFCFNHVKNPFGRRQVTPMVGSQWIAPTLCLQPCYKSFFLQVGRTYGRFLVDGTYLLPSTMSQILLAIGRQDLWQVLSRWHLPSAFNHVTNPFGHSDLHIHRRKHLGSSIYIEGSTQVAPPTKMVGSTQCLELCFKSFWPKVASNTQKTIFQQRNHDSRRIE